VIPAFRVALLGIMTATSASAARAQAGMPVDTITVTHRVLVAGDVTPADAKRKALEQALAEAVRRIVGVRVQSAQLAVDEDRGGRVRDSFLSVVQLDAAGRATDYRVLDERFVSERHPTLGAQLYLELRALVSVARERGSADAGFTVSVSLNDALFFDGGGSIDGNDELIATITASRDAWLTVFGVVGDSAQLLLPNAVMTDHRAGSGAAVELPSREWRDRGVHFRASLPAGEQARRELLVVVATRSPVAFALREPRSSDGADASFPLLEIQRWLVTIPLDQRAIAFAPYEVRRK
jgi:hypothetical protein